MTSLDEKVPVYSKEEIPANKDMFLGSYPYGGNFGEVSCAVSPPVVVPLSSDACNVTSMKKFPVYSKEEIPDDVLGRSDMSGNFGEASYAASFPPCCLSSSSPLSFSPCPPPVFPPFPRMRVLDLYW